MFGLAHPQSKSAIATTENATKKAGIAGRLSNLTTEWVAVA
jgi:hypothetical protein